MEREMLNSLHCTLFLMLAGCLFPTAFIPTALAQSNPDQPASVAAWNLTSYSLQSPAWPENLIAESALPDSADRAALAPLTDFFTVSLQLGDELFTAGLQLAPVRSPAFKQCIDRGRSNSTPGQPDPAIPARELSYAGSIASKPGSRVVVSFVAGMARAIIDLGPTPDGSDSPFWFVQSARELHPAAKPAADSATYVAYPASAAQLPSGYRCGGQITPPDDHQHPGNNEPSPEGPTCNRLVDIALDADFALYTANGSSTVTTQADIDSIMSGLRLIYARDTSVVFNISATIIRTTDSLYNTTNIYTLLNAVQNEWQTNQAAIARDLTHLLTGQPTGNIIGVAYLSVVCTNSAYGVSNILFTANLSNRIGVVAHEIGHNFSAGHCDGDNDCFIMCSSIGGCSNNVTRFGSRSVTAVRSHATSRVCMTNAGPFATPVAPRATDDTITVGTTPATIDVLFNDTDANCDPITISNFPPTSPRGATITRSVGVGNRERLIYTPVIGNSVADTFTYTASDATFSSAATVRVNSAQTRNPDTTGPTRPGLDVKFYAISNLSVLPDFSPLTPYLISSAADINIATTDGIFSNSGRADNVAAIYTGFITAPVAAQYTFFTESDDGSRLYIGPDLVVNNDGLHGMQERSGLIALKAGTHAFSVAFFETSGGAGLIARWQSTGGIAKAVIPAASFLRPGIACSTADIAGSGPDGRTFDGIVDGSDFIAFINSFSTGDATVDPLADISGGGPSANQPDGIIDGADFITFINAFAAGC